MKNTKEKRMARTNTSSGSRGRSVSRSTKKLTLKDRFFRWRYAKPASFALIFAVIGLGTMFVALAAVPKGQIVGKASGKCIDNHSERRENKNPIVLYPCSAKNAAQTWTLQADKSLRNGRDFCLDVVYAGTKPKTGVWLYKCSTPVNEAQKWDIGEDGTIRNPRSGLCLEAKDQKTATGTRLWINTCNGNSSQIWKVPKVTNPLPIPSPTPTPEPEPAPSPTPAPGGGNSGLSFPNCSALGPKSALTTHSGSFWSDQGSASGKAITGDLIMDSSAANYTTSNFSVQGKVKNELSGTSSLNVSDFIVKHPSYSGDWGLGYHNVTAKRFRVENHSDGIRVAGTGSSLYEDFCVTGIARSGDHSDGVQFYGSTNANAVTTFRRGIISMPSGDATAGIFAADNAKGKVVVDTVLLIGGPYGIRINSDGTQQIALRNVRFRKGSFGAAPFSIASNVRITEWTNVAYEDGTPIPPPHAVQP